MKKVEDFDASIDVLKERIYRLKNQKKAFLFLMFIFGFLYVFFLLIGITISTIPYALSIISLLIIIAMGFFVAGLGMVAVSYDKTIYNFIIYLKEIKGGNKNGQ